MAEGNPLTSHPYQGRDKRPDDADLPGERGVSEREQHQGPPADRRRDHETASRAPEEDSMSADDPGIAQPTSGIPEQVDAPNPADATEGDPPGGSAANQRGRAPDQ
jgi:hypothetical protein